MFLRCFGTFQAHAAFLLFTVEGNLSFYLIFTKGKGRNSMKQHKLIGIKLYMTGKYHSLQTHTILDLSK